MFMAIGLLLVLLYTEYFRPTVSFFLVIVMLNVVGVIDPQDVLSGFANEQLAVIILFLAISDVIRKSSVVDNFFFQLMGRTNSKKKFLAKMMLLVASFSSFFNNTPLVAMMLPHVNKWSVRNNVAVSKLMIPLSYAAILGGCITLVGTSTNLIVNGMAVDAGLDSLGIFDFALVGLPMLAIGIIYLMVFGPKLLPDADGVVSEFIEHSRDYLIEAEVKSGSGIIGRSVEEAGLRNMESLFLVEILRDDKLITPISPEEELMEGDVLIFTGNTQSIDELKNPRLGLTLPKACETLVNDKSVVTEVVVSQNSYLIGRRVKDSEFRGKYDGAIVAVHRNGERLSGKIGDINLRAGDVLLVFGGKDFQIRTSGNQAFYSISEITEPDNVNFTRVGVVILGLIFSIVLAALGIMKLFTGLIVVLLAALMMKIVPPHEIRKGMDFNLIFLLALGLALGKAMLNSGAAEYLSGWVLLMADYIHPVGLLGFLFIITNILSAYITNKAAIAIIFPISMVTAQTLSLPLPPFIMVVAFGAAASFISPIGYQTNLMVYGPGGYTFRDFFRIGLPLSILYALVCTLVLSLTYNLI